MGHPGRRKPVPAPSGQGRGRIERGDSANSSWGGERAGARVGAELGSPRCSRILRTTGSVRMVVRLDEHELSDHRYLCFDVIDTGIGIAADKAAADLRLG